MKIVVISVKNSLMEGTLDAQPFSLYIPLKSYKTNYLLHYLLITLRNTRMTIIAGGAIGYDNPVAINIERNRNYQVDQEECTTHPQSRTQEPPADSYNLCQLKTQ